MKDHRPSSKKKSKMKLRWRWIHLVVVSVIITMYPLQIDKAELEVAHLRHRHTPKSQLLAGKRWMSAVDLQLTMIFTA
jgi:hypothetical protein